MALEESGYGSQKQTSSVRSFLLTSLSAFFITGAVLFALDLTPEYAPETSTIEVAEAQVQSMPLRPDPNPSVEANAIPRRIVAESVGLDVAVVNPNGASLAVLNDALLQGAVRYPGSGTLADNENMFILGHSSFLPVVRNPAYQAFNGLKELNEGDVIRVYSDHREYLYRVESIAHVNATETAIPLKTGSKRLTLTTCDTFGEKTDRYVVDASYIGSYSLETFDTTSTEQ